MRDDDRQPGRPDVADRDFGEQRPDLGDGSTGHELLGARTEGGPEVVAVRVDEEVDGVGLRDAQELGRLGDRVLGDLEGALGVVEISGLPVDGDQVALQRLPVDPIVLDQERGFGARLGRTGGRCHPEAVADAAVGQLERRVG